MYNVDLLKISWYNYLKFVLIKNNFISSEISTCISSLLNLPLFLLHCVE